MPILTYVTRVDVAAAAVLSGATYSTAIETVTGSVGSKTVSQSREIVLNVSTIDETISSVRSTTGSFLSTASPSWSYAITENFSRHERAKIVSYGSNAVTFEAVTSESSTKFGTDQGFRFTHSQADNDTWGATEVEAYGTTGESLVYSFSRTSRARQTVLAGYTGTTTARTSSTSTGSTSSTSYTSSAGKFFSKSARVNASTTVGQNVTYRYVATSSTRTHTLTYGGSVTYTFTETTRPGGTATLTVTRTSTSFPGSQSATVTQRVPVTSSSFTTRAISWFTTGGSHYHFSDNPQTVYANLLVYDELTTSAQQIALGATATGYQYASQLAAGGTGYSTTFSFVYGQVGSSTFGVPAGTTGTTTLVYDSYSPTGATASFALLSRAFQLTPGSWQIVGANYSEARAVLTPFTETLTTGQTFATQSTSSSSGTGAGGSSTRFTTYGYVTASGPQTRLTTIVKTLWEALGTTTSSSTMRLSATSTSASTESRSFTVGSTVGSSSGTSQTSVVHGTVDRAFYSRTTSFAEHAANVPANRFSQQVLMGPFLHSPSATHVYNSMDNVLMFSLSSYAAHDGNLPGLPIGFIPLSGTTLHSSTYYTQAYSINSNSTSLSFTSRAASAAASQTSTSSHVKAMANTFAAVTIHGNNHSATLDSTTLRSFPSGTGGAYSTSSSQAHLMETPSFVASAIHGTVGLDGTAGYNLEHDLVYGSGTAGSIRNASTGTSAFPVSRSLASQRIFYGLAIASAAPAFSECAPSFTELTINPFRTMAPL